MYYIDGVFVIIRRPQKHTCPTVGCIEKASLDSFKVIYPEGASYLHNLFW